MTIRVTTRHSEDFDICTNAVDPSKSPYAREPDYAAKVTALYQQLGVASAIWTTREADRPKYFEKCKPVEYVLEVDEGRVIGYVDELIWREYLCGERHDFTAFSKTPMKYETTSILLSTPLTPADVKARRRYRSAGPPSRYKLVEEVLYSAEKPFAP